MLHYTRAWWAWPEIPSAWSERSGASHLPAVATSACTVSQVALTKCGSFAVVGSGLCSAC